MSQLLTSRQSQELNKAIIAYLTTLNLPSGVDFLRDELNLGDSFDTATCKKYEGLLEKKWTSVMRLQKKIIELESKIGILQKEIDQSISSSLSRRNQDAVSWLPEQTARYAMKGHMEPITSVAFHPIYSVLASGSQDCTVKVWDWDTGDLIRTLKGHTKAVNGVDFGGPSGTILLASCSSDLTIKLWDPGHDYQNIRSLMGHDHSISSVRFLPSTQPSLLASASRDKCIRIWDTSTGFCLTNLQGHVEWVRDLHPSFDGQWLVSCSSDKTGMIWKTSTAEHKATLLGHENFIECCIFAPPATYGYLARLAGSGKPPSQHSAAEFVATGARDNTIKLWDIRGTLIKTLIGHDAWVRGMVFHPGGKYLLSVADDKTVRCWDLSQDARLVKTIAGAHEHFVTCIRWVPVVINEDEVPANGVGQSDSPQSKPKIRCVIATGSVDATLRVFA